LHPHMIRIKQTVPALELSHVRQAMLDTLQGQLKETHFSGLSVGITVGSRGISRIPEILKAVIEFVQERGGNPILLPAMGTHGGGTVEGQHEILTSLGITQESMGVPIQFSTDTVLLGKTPSGVEVHCNVEATKVDKLIVMNRIKAHTDFSGKIESGICKMLAIGLGNPRGALETHSNALLLGYEKVITEVAHVMIEKLPLVLAIGILENWKGLTASIEALPPENIMTIEPQLLARAKEGSIKLPFKAIDVLVLEEIGKEISGTGMDTKVVGRIMVKGQVEPDTPSISRIVVLGLTPESHGNAIGIGLADITTREVLESIDIKKTSFNSISSMSPEQGRIPCVLENDYEAISAACSTLGNVHLKKVRLVYIKNTLKIEELFVSESLLEEVRENPNLEIISSPQEFEFNPEGKLKSWWTDVQKR
jgi:hypothetical protein